MEQLLEQIRDWVWSAPLLALLLGTGVYLTLLLRGVQFRYLGCAFRQLVSKRKKYASGDIGHFEALMTSLAGAIGTGSIVGVAMAVTIGGFGSIFWMWVTTFFGMALKYAESLLAVKYREVDKRGEMVGGPMSYMERGLGWKKTALLFSLFGAVAAIGTGNLVQVNSIAEALSDVWQFDPWLTGVSLSLLTGVVLLGGVKSIGRVSGFLVPLMGLFYLAAALYVLGARLEFVPQAFSLIFKSAFRSEAALGGFVGGSAMLALQMGVSRAVFSNEAGLGISSIAAAAAKTDCPGRQAMITMTGALLSTVVVCTLTGLVFAVTGVVGEAAPDGTLLQGAPLAIRAFESVISGGRYLVTIGLVLFAYSTTLAWAYYGEKCFEHLLGERAVPYYRALFSLIVIPGAAINMRMAWYIADITNGLMAIPNCLALIFLSGALVGETKAFLKLVERERLARKETAHA